MSAFFVRKGTLCMLLQKEMHAEWSGLWLNLQAKSYNDVFEVWDWNIFWGFYYVLLPY
jgi:hypothetical protein